MPITDQDIQILQSERLTDFDDGGGRMTGAQVVDGQTNNLFPDVSELDRTYGRVSLRKAFVAVLTDLTEVLYGTHAAITDPPDDGSVNVCMFSRDSWTDERLQAQDRVESFVISAPESRFVLYGDHLTGMRILRWYCAADVPSPDVGSVYRLSVEADGYTPVEQYVRVQSVEERTTQTFTEVINDTIVTFSKDVLLLEISAELNADFPGGTPSSTSTGNAPTLVRSTQVADAARYYGVRPLVAAASLGDLQVNVGTPYLPIVPSTETETGMTDVQAGADKTSLVPSGAAGVLTWSGALAGTVSPTFAAVRYLGMGCARASVTVTIGSTTLSDDGSGHLYPQAGDTSGYGGSVDYTSGMVSITRNVSWAATVAMSAQPAAATGGIAHTHEITVTISNRAYNYVPVLYPVPAPGTVVVEYMALGQWIRLTDNGQGQLTGRTGEGTGTINYATGSLLVTLGALPDVGSSILFYWGTPIHFERRDGDVDIASARLTHTVAAPIVPNTLTITWLEGGIAKTSTDNGAGLLTGDATGEVDYVTGEIQMAPATAPDPNSLIQLVWSDHTLQASGSVDANVTDRTYTFDIGAVLLPLRAGSVRLAVTLATAVNYGSTPLAQAVTWVDDGAGALTGNGLATGTINYTTGAVSVTLAATADAPARYGMIPWNGVPGGAGGGLYSWGTRTRPITPAATEAFGWTAEQNGATAAPQSAEVTHGGMVLDLTPLIVDQVVAGSVRLTWAGQTYVDRAGSVYRAVDPTTNTGTLAGTIDYATGQVVLTDYAVGANTVVVSSLLTAFGAWDVSSLFFRASGAPLKPQSVTVRATTSADSTQILGTADVNGDIATADMEGTVDVTTGIVRMWFGAWVVDANLTAEEKADDWYDAANVQLDGTIWRPTRVQPGTITYNAVVYTYIPLSAAILGLDPVRLPQDGRVPMYRSGDVLLVHHSQVLEVASPVAAGVETLRPLLGFVMVHDSLGAAIPSDRFTVDLDAGELTWADPLTLTGYTLPLFVTHRIEDLVLCSDVQITGELSLVSSLSHNYPADTSLVSSCLLISDMQARVEKIHDLTTFTEWADTPTGDEAPANFNSVQYPVVVTNRGAAEERWRVTFSGSATVNVIGETFGQVRTNAAIAADIAPLNPATGVPYFTLPWEGWGGGWSTGNTLRFNTRGANYPIWLCRTITQGPATVPQDTFRLQIRGDAS